MSADYVHIGVDKPAKYSLLIQGRIERDLSDWFWGDVYCIYDATASGEVFTMIIGILLDQAALFGLLNYIRDLGMALILVDCLDAHSSA